MKTWAKMKIQSAQERTVLEGAGKVILEAAKLHSGWILKQGQGFPGGSVGKESVCKAGDPGSIPWSGRSLGEGHGNLLQYSCLENSVDTGAWRATVHGVAKSWT